MRRLLCAAAFGLLALAAMVTHSLAAEDYRLLTLDGNLVKWGGDRLGSGAVVTYAYATAPMEFESARNCGHLIPLSELNGFEERGELVRREVEAAFQLWTTAADIRFRRVDDPQRADIVIGAQGAPKGRAFANVAYDTGIAGASESNRAAGLSGSEDADIDERQPGLSKPVKPIKRSLVCLNPEERWKIGFDGNLSIYDLRFTFAHEIGHAIGLDHPGSRGEVMGFRYDETIRTLQPGDIKAATIL
jgi:hypothetical protein